MVKTCLVLLTVISLSCFVRAELTVLAAASTTDALREIGAIFTEQTGHVVRFSFASSGALARQIQSGAPADVFLSANETWMDALEAARLIDSATRIDLLQNRLVIIVPAGKLPPECRISSKEPKSEEVAIRRSSEFLVQYSAGSGGRLAVGDIHSVPVGMYARQALEHSGQFDALRSRVVMASNARAALMFVERGEADAGIVYATDAQISDRVNVVSVFPEESHSPICYPAAVCVHAAHPEAAHDFLEFLQSETAGMIFKRYGFER